MSDLRKIKERIVNPNTRACPTPTTPKVETVKTEVIDKSDKKKHQFKQVQKPTNESI